MERVKAIELGREMIMPGQETPSERFTNTILEFFTELKKFAVRVCAVLGIIAVYIWLHYEVTVFPAAPDEIMPVPHINHHSIKR